MPIKPIAKLCSVAAILFLLVAALGPASWSPRSGLGWQFDHFIGYFVITSVICIAWARPILVGAVVIVIAILLEGFQAFTPDRSANILAAFFGASGALVAALVAEIATRAWKWHVSK